MERVIIFASDETVQIKKGLTISVAVYPWFYQSELGILNYFQCSLNVYKKTGNPRYMWIFLFEILKLKRSHFKKQIKSNLS